MSKKSGPAVESPKPAELPNPENSPAVAATRERHNALAAKLSAIRAERKQAERDLGARAGESDDDLEAKLLARGQDTDKLTRLRELRRGEQVTEKAVTIVAEELNRARDTATREMTAFVREDVFLPAVRAAVKDWLDAVRKVEKFRRLVDDIQGRGLGSGTHCPFNGRIPLSLADQDSFTAFVGDLLGEGFIDRDTINASFPGLI